MNHLAISAVSALCFPLVASAWPVHGYPVNGDLFDAAGGVLVTDHSPLCCGSDAANLFRAAENHGAEPAVAFVSGMPEGFVHFVEWETAGDVRVGRLSLALP